MIKATIKNLDPVFCLSGLGIVFVVSSTSPWPIAVCSAILIFLLAIDRVLIKNQREFITLLLGQLKEIESLNDNE